MPSKKALGTRMALSASAAFFMLLFLSGYAAAQDDWWNSSWHFRVRVDVNASTYDRTEWPVEQNLNFTAIILNKTGNNTPFDANSVRVVEYYQNGSVQFDNSGAGIVSQFDASDAYNAANNAYGEVVWLMNGTTAANANRTYYVYFDTANYPKGAPIYTSRLAYYANQSAFNMTNTRMNVSVDTQHGAKNHSGMYRVAFSNGATLFDASASDLPIEYISYYNATHQFEYDFANNFTLKVSGPVKIVVEQKGFEKFWNTTTRTGQGNMTKRYTLFENNSYARVEQVFTNNATFALNRSTNKTADTASALAIDVQRAFGTVGSGTGAADPYSWRYMPDSTNAKGIGVINVNETNTTNYVAQEVNAPEFGGVRVGISLAETNVSSGDLIGETALVVFDSAGSSTSTQDLRNRLQTPASISNSSGEVLTVIVNASTNGTNYLQGQSVLVMGNVTADTYNVTRNVTALLWNGTIVQLYDGGSAGHGIGNYSAALALASSETLGAKNVTVQARGSAGTIINASVTTINVNASTTTVQVLQTPQVYTANITWNASAYFVINVTLNNTGSNSANYTNITIATQGGLQTNSTNAICATPLSPGATCTAYFNITVPAKTASGLYNITALANWTNADASLGSSQNYTVVNVTANATMVVNTTAIIANVTANNTPAQAGAFNISSTGNDAVAAIAINVSGANFTTNAGDASKIRVTFNASYIASLASGSNATVLVNVTVPLGFENGTYEANITINSTNALANRSIALNVTVPFVRSWNFTTSPSPCRIDAIGDTGTLCSVTVFNTGNGNASFTVTNSTFNYTAANVTSFVLNKTQNITFAVTYNVSGVSIEGNYTTLYNITAVEADATPQTSSFNATVRVFREPFVNASAVPEFVEQLGAALINATVIDRSGYGINPGNVSVRVTRLSDNVTFGPVNMTNSTLSLPAGTSYWYAAFPSTWGNTSQKGAYQIAVQATDNGGKNGTGYRNFSVYTMLLVDLHSGAGQYLRGDAASVYYGATDLNASGIAGVNVTLTIRNPNGTAIFNNSYATSASGRIEPMPQFTLTADALTGNYSITANATYYDALANYTANKTTQYNFTVVALGGPGIALEAVTSVIWYAATGNNLRTIAYLTQNGQPVDADSVKITIYDPTYPLSSSAIVLNATMDRVKIGVYWHQYALADAAAKGMYLVEVYASAGGGNLTKGAATRVSSGGPFDINVSAYDTQQGSNARATLSLKNKGETRLEVREYDADSQSCTPTGGTACLTCYAQSGTGNRISGTSFSTMSSFLIEAQETRGVDAYIKTSPLALGSYYYYCEISYASEKPASGARGGFSIIPYVATPTPTPAGAPGAGAGGPSGGGVAPGGGASPTPSATPTPTLAVGPRLEVVEKFYTEEVEVEVGGMRYFSLRVRNGGSVALRGVSLSLSGVPAAWAEVMEGSVDTLAPGSSTTFVVKIAPPADVKPADYMLMLDVRSDQVSDRKAAVIKVFASKEEVLRYQLKKTREEIAALRNSTAAAGREGRNVSKAEGYVNEAIAHADDAEDTIGRKLYDDAANQLRMAKNALESAKYELEAAMPPAFVEAAPIDPTLIAFLIALMLAFMVMVAYWMRKSSSSLERMAAGIGGAARKEEGATPVWREPVREIKEALAQKTSVKELKEDKDRIERLLEILERDYRKGMISKKSYDELSEKNMDKLRELEVKISARIEEMTPYDTSTASLRKRLSEVLAKKQ